MKSYVHLYTKFTVYVQEQRGASTRKLIIYIIALFEIYNDPRTSILGTDFIDSFLN